MYGELSYQLRLPQINNLFINRSFYFPFEVPNIELYGHVISCFYPSSNKKIANS
jgi:hypothetical protein